MKKIINFLICAVLILSGPASALPANNQKENLKKIKHIIIISLENHSFDNLFAWFADAEGIAKPGNTVTQTDKNGIPYETLPPVIDNRKNPPIQDPRFPIDLPNRPFPIDQYVPENDKTGDLVHRFYQEQEQIDKGKMDHFAFISNAGGLAMGYHDAINSKLWEYARKYTLADHFFHAAFGGSFLNHFWLICACTPRYENAPQDIRISLDKHGNLVTDGAVTKDGYAVNTLYPTSTPHPASGDSAKLLPPQTMPTIGDRLSQKGISWAWYSGGWNDAIAGKPAPTFEFHHQPFAYFKQFADGTAARKKYLKDESDFLDAIKNGKLPAVSFYKPLGEYDLHPGYANITSGDAHLEEIMKAIEASPEWKDSLVIITFDENGGYWDHVPPPIIDRWGPGVRVPTIIVSPFAKQNFVDHTVYDTTSILKLIETRFGLTPLTSRDAKANDLLNTLKFE